MDNKVLADSAYASILDLILSSEIKPGERIREDLLAEKFGISRTPVREAVNRLTQNGFVVNIKRKGIYCLEITKDDLLNLLDLRRVLESLSVSKCVENANPKDIKEIRKLIADFRYEYNYTLYNSDFPEKSIAKLHNFEDVRFHVRIAQISGSERLVKYISDIENTLLLARQRIYEKDEGARIIHLSWEQHEHMIDAIAAGDRVKACEVLEQHLKLMRDTQVNVYQ